MSEDGASMGVGAERAIATILGGEPSPGEEEQETVEQMRERILSQPIVSESYDGTATACARLILEALEKHDELRLVPVESQYLKTDEGKPLWVNESFVYYTTDLHSVLKVLYAADPAALHVFSGLTGFQWGWAVNAARRCMGESEVSNPAIVEIG